MLSISLACINKANAEVAQEIEVGSADMFKWKFLILVSDIKITKLRLTVL